VDIDIGAERALGEALGGAQNLALAGKKGQQAPWLRVQGAADGASHGLLDGQAIVATKVAGVHRPGAAMDFDHPGAAQDPGDPRAVQGGGHDQEAQVVADQLLGVAGEGQAEIGIEAAFVAARRRGSSTMSLPPLAQGEASRARGATVVLPAPGGATRTAVLAWSRWARSSGRTSRIGRSAAASVQFNARPRPFGQGS
jgi:hypothetical protein